MQQQASYPSPKVAAIPSGAPAIAVRSDPPPAAACQRVWSLWRDRWRMCGGVPTQASVIRLAPIVRTTTDLTSYVANAGVRVPSDLRVNEGLYLMPIGVEPKYDDPRTRRGGHFGFRSTGGNDPSAAPAFAWAQWVAMADALLTGKIEDPHRVALGCSLVRKPDGFSLKMWVADAAPREHARLRAALLGLLRLRPGSVRYSPHSCILRNPGVRAAVATATATTRSRHDSTSSRDSNGMSASPNTSSVGTPRRTPSPTTLTETAAWADSLTEEEGLEMIWPEPVEEDAQQQQQQQRPAAETPPEMYLPVPVFTNVYYPPHLQQYQQQQQQQQQHNPYYTPYPYYASPHYYHLHHYHQAPVEAPTVAPVPQPQPQPHAPQFHAEATTDATTTTSGTRTPESLAGSDSPAPTQLGTGFCRFVLPRSFAPLRAIIRCVDDGYPRSESEPEEEEEEEEAFLPEESRSFDRVPVKDSDWLAEQSAGEAVQRRRASC